MDNNTIASRIKELRTSLELTQSDFAESINTTQAALSGYERGDRVPSIDILICISEKYNASIDWLCGLSDTKSLNLTPKTYADVLRLLSIIEAVPELDLEISYEPPNGYHGDPFEGPTLGCIKFDDEILKSFLTEWSDMISLREKGTIKDALYQLWLNDKITSYNDTLISCSNRIWGPPF